MSAAAWDWAHLDDEGAADTWADLAEWVEWLVTRYDLGDELPPCWWAHPPITEELTALWVAWLGAYRHPEAGWDRPLNWHKELESVRTRIKLWDRLGCGRGAHRDGGQQPWEFSQPEFAAHVRADVARRSRRTQLRSLP